MRFKHSRRQFPKGCGTRVGRHAQVAGVCPSAQARTHIAEALRDRRSGAAHQAQQASLNQRNRFSVGLNRSRQGVAGQDLPVPVEHPQVSGVSAVGTGRVLHGLILREKRQCRHRLARQHARQIVKQRKRRPLDVIHHAAGQQLGFDHRALQHVFTGPQQGGSGTQPDHFQSAHALVQLLSRGAQHRRIHRVKVGACHRIGFFDKAAQGLVGRFQRTTQLDVNPGHGAQVAA